MSHLEETLQGLGSQVDDSLNMTDPNTALGRAKRVRTLTDKGRKLFTTTRNDFLAKLQKSWKSVENLLPDVIDGNVDVLQLRQQEKQLTKSFDVYKKHSADFMVYLIQTNTKESQMELLMHEAVRKANDDIIDQALSLLDNQMQCILGSISHRSRSSQRSKSIGSQNSRTSSILAQKRARAEAARTRVQFAAKESDIKKQHAELNEKTAKVQRERAELEADLELLKQQREAAAAQAEVEALENFDNQSRQSPSVNPGDYIPEQTAMEKTEEYVSGLQDPTILAHQDFTDPRPTHNNVFPSGEQCFGANNPPQVNQIPHHPAMFTVPPPPPFMPSPEVMVTSEITRFLLKKELLLSRLTNYDDKPETYCAWKSGFLNIVQELQVSPMEELDLLVKWLGPESSKHAISIRTSNARNPASGRARIWERLDERFGSPEMVEAALKKKLSDFPKLSYKDYKKLYDLADILSEIESAKEDESYRPLLAYFDSSTGIIPIVRKLPCGVQEKWTTAALKYKKAHRVTFPPFTFFADFIRDVSKTKNDPSFAYGEPPSSAVTKKDNKGNQKTAVFTRKTEISQQRKDECLSPSQRCPLHNINHSLNDCRGFRAKPIRDRKEFLKTNGICFKCCASTDHMFRACKETVECGECHSQKHATALHTQSTDMRKSDSCVSSPKHGGEKSTETKETSSVTSNCTQICGEKFSGKSCAKTVLVNVYPDRHPELSHKMYALLDDQSNLSLAKSGFFDLMNINSKEIPYTLSSCAGSIKTTGRRATGYVIESIDHNDRLKLPSLIECNQIPNIRSEIPTPQVAEHFEHLKDIARHIPQLDDKAEILLLIGRDLLEAHHVQSQRVGAPNTPYAQKLRLGWVIVGEACLGRIHRSDTVNVNKTYLLNNRRPSLFQPCPNRLNVRNCDLPSDTPENVSNGLGDTVFEKTPNDDKVGMSIEDKQFIRIMDQEVHRDSSGNWVAPLPFRSPRVRLPNNKPQAVKRAQTLHRSLQRDPVKKQHFKTFMQRVIDSGHSEVAPPLKDGEECWYLPIFGVYHPQKPDQIRGVFDSSAQYQGVSLNNVLLTGPDLTNNLLGILLRFRKEAVAITADIQQMFYNFMVREDHRNFLRFLWYRDNDPEQDLIEYRMCVHVFGNSPSPAIATYGLRKAVQVGEGEFGNDVVEYVNRNFYVDDGLASLRTPEEAIDLVKRTQQALQSGGNLRLHKIASNSTQVMDEFPVEDRASNLKDLDLHMDTPPLQRSLGLAWNLQSDTFTFQVSEKEKPHTKRGVLSTVNSLYDPLGFVAPVTIKGKIILRESMTTTTDWDNPLPAENRPEWDSWRESLTSLQEINIPRTYSPVSIGDALKKEIHVYSDASEKAIAAVAYLKTISTEGNQSLGFILGKAKVAPLHSHTIPRLELCAAVLAVEIAEMICDQLDFVPDALQFYTDSKIVLGYINNQSRRFYVYVCNRVERIRRFTKPEQWNYVPTDENPADHATRSLPAEQVGESAWVLGPQRLLDHTHDNCTSYPLVNPEKDSEVRPQAVTLKTNVANNRSIGCHRFERFSSWATLVRTIANLKHIASSRQHDDLCNGWHMCPKSRTTQLYTEAERFIIKSVQREVFEEELDCLRSNKPLPKTSPLLTLNPIVDINGLLRVGGRLTHSDLANNEKHPIILPARHHISILLVRHYHESIKHQGRHLTEGALRSAGLWIIGGKRLISSLLHKCVKCRKLRGKQEVHKMADLPPDRLTPGPAFSFVGVDTFGPWTVVGRRTRGGQANNKRWAIMFTCLTTRAVHIEVIEDMGSSSFINALRRLIAIRGKVTELRSDRGTNFVGATDDLEIDAIHVEDGPVKEFLYNKGVTWTFNPPHSSHMGGVWERMIGVTRRILDSMMTGVVPNNLTHEVLTTFMAEASAIINARPIVPVSSDPDCPQILSPSTLLTLKTDHVTEPSSEWNIKDLYKAQWRRVQALADTFWNRWRHEYLHTLQTRRKWHDDRPNIKKGDVILLKEKSAHRNEWPIGIVVDPIPGDDNKVRKATVRVIKDGKPTMYLRPITELVLLLSD